VADSTSSRSVGVTLPITVIFVSVTLQSRSPLALGLKDVIWVPYVGMSGANASCLVGINTKLRYFRAFYF
jgi:hypothetical protein